MLIKTGVPQKKDLKEIMPSQRRMERGPVAIFECFQPIPCNPCEDSCPQKAVVIGQDINNIPDIDFEKCNGCSICVSVCPGLAVFVVDVSGEKGKITLPYEFIPLPAIGEEVIGLNRYGKPVEKCTVSNIRTGKSFNKTTLITIETSTKGADEIRFIKLKGEKIYE
ncbi:4Fe-4S dicluster domain-containing protein [Proteinivorax tanatarense]|uniref:4Fe-4S dicluster domain-containing protein n=1 Tax=Proteinivorax tanatarense TaxID=1260629 RepID=A0AAU7VIB9_9FIRM